MRRHHVLIPLSLRCHLNGEHVILVKLLPEDGLAGSKHVGVWYKLV